MEVHRDLAETLINAGIKISSQTLTSTLTTSNSQVLITVISGVGAKVNLQQPVPENYNKYFLQTDVDAKHHIFLISLLWDYRRLGFHYF